jgi:hypothetical protein
MAAEVGDKVRFMDVTGGGVITRIEGRLAFVDDEDGFETPVLVSDLVIVEKQGGSSDNKIATTGSSETAASTEDNEEDYSYEDEDTEGDEDPSVMLAFLQGDKPGVQSGGVRINLINDSNYFCSYAINEIGNNNQAINMYQGNLVPNTKIELGKQLVTELDGKKYDVQLIMYKKQKRFTPIPAVQKSFTFKGAKLINDNSYTENDFFDEKALIFHILKGEMEQRFENLTTQEIEAAMKEKSVTSSSKKKVKRRDEPEILEVDLHIHELLDDIRGLSNTEMLGVQMDKFNQVMKDNINRKKRKIVFIHGVGNGTLKTELRKALDRKYKSHYYQDASFREYGYGATMVII